MLNRQTEGMRRNNWLKEMQSNINKQYHTSINKVMFAEKTNNILSHANYHACC